MRQGGSQNAAVQRGGLWSVGQSVSHRVCCDGGDVGKADGLEILLSGLCLYLLNTFRTCLASVYQYGSRVSVQAPASGPSIS